MVFGRQLATCQFENRHGKPLAALNKEEARFVISAARVRVLQKERPGHTDSILVWLTVSNTWPGTSSAIPCSN